MPMKNVKKTKMTIKLIERKPKLFTFSIERRNPSRATPKRKICEAEKSTPFLKSLFPPMKLKIIPIKRDTSITGRSKLDEMKNAKHVTVDANKIPGMV